MRSRTLAVNRIFRHSIFALVAFIDEPTPNVMLELGYALGAAKQVLLIRSREARIPFDVASLPVAHFDECDTGSLFAIAEQLRIKANFDAPPDRQFIGIRDQLAQMVKDSDYLEQLSAQQFAFYNSCKNLVSKPCKRRQHAKPVTTFSLGTR